jgi:transketolase
MRYDVCWVTTPAQAQTSALARTCVETRLATLDMVETAGSGHFGPAFSVVEILVSLYYGLLRVRPEEPRWPARDRFVMSKGHAVSVLYPILADLGFIDRSVLATFTQLGSPLGDHPDMKKVAGIDFSSGSLGHGLSIGVGMAEAVRLQGHDSRVVVLLGDGELDEGQIWEAVTYAAHRRLGSLLGIVDVNDVSVDGRTDDVLRVEPIGAKWQAFGWHVEHVDGHDLEALLGAYARFDERRRAPGAPPTVLVADTVAGRGISFIEGMAEWHVGYLHGEDRRRAERSIRAMHGLEEPR